MFEKIKLNKNIKKYKKIIANIEKKRYRSQAALVEAILKQETPDDNDVDYFNKYTAQIEETRDKLHAEMAKLEELK